MMRQLLLSDRIGQTPLALLRAMLMALMHLPHRSMAKLGVGNTGGRSARLAALESAAKPGGPRRCRKHDRDDGEQLAKHLHGCQCYADNTHNAITIRNKGLRGRLGSSMLFRVWVYGSSPRLRRHEWMKQSAVFAFYSPPKLRATLCVSLRNRLGSYAIPSKKLRKINAKSSTSRITKSEWDY